MTRIRIRYAKGRTAWFFYAERRVGWKRFGFWKEIDWSPSIEIVEQSIARYLSKSFPAPERNPGIVREFDA